MKIINRNNQNSPNFKAKLEIDLSEKFLSYLAAHPVNTIKSRELLTGIEYLKKVAPGLGSDAESLRLSSLDEDKLLISFRDAKQEVKTRYLNVLEDIYDATEALMSIVLKNERVKMRGRSLNDNLSPEQYADKLRKLNTQA